MTNIHFLDYYIIINGKYVCWRKLNFNVHNRKMNVDQNENDFAMHLVWINCMWISTSWIQIWILTLLDIFNLILNQASYLWVSSNSIHSHWREVFQVVLINTIHSCRYSAGHVMHGPSKALTHRKLGSADLVIYGENLLGEVDWLCRPGTSLSLWKGDVAITWHKVGKGVAVWPFLPKDQHTWGPAWDIGWDSSGGRVHLGRSVLALVQAGGFG